MSSRSRVYKRNPGAATIDVTLDLGALRTTVYIPFISAQMPVLSHSSRNEVCQQSSPYVPLTVDLLLIIIPSVIVWKQEKSASFN